MNSASVNTKSNLSDILLIWIKPVAQYWFLYSLLWIFIIYVILDNWLKDWQIVALLAITSFIISYFKICGGILDNTLKISIVFGFGMQTQKLITDDKGKLRQYAILVCGTIFGCIILYFGLNNYWLGDQIARICGIYASISLVSILSEFNIAKKVLSFVGAYSFPIYLLHTIFTAGLRIFLMKLGIMYYSIHVLCGILIGIVGPIVVAYICKKIPYLNFMFYPSKYLERK